MEIPQRGQKKQLSINDIFSWLKAYTRFMAVMLSNPATSKEEVAGLAAHMHLILQLSGDLRGLQWLRYDQEFRRGISLWRSGMVLWDLGLQVPNVQVYTDASGNWGCGAFLDPMWFHPEWSTRLCPLSIGVKEMCPVVLATATFGQRWVGKVVQFVVDNEAVKATYSKDLHLMHLIRLLDPNTTSGSQRLAFKGNSM